MPARATIARTRHRGRGDGAGTLFDQFGLGAAVDRLSEAPTVIRPGDVVFIKPDEDHWHGATANRFMAHVAIQQADENGKVVTWLDHVTDDGYSSAH